MSLRRFVTILIGMVLVSSCKDDLFQEDNQGMPIRIVSGTKATTRAADGLNDTNFPSGVPIKVAVDGREYNYTTNGAGVAMTCTSATPPYFPIDGSSVKLQAYYPTNFTYATTPQNFTVLDDQSGDNSYKASDLMYGEPSPNGTPVGWSGLDGSGKVMPTADPVPLVFQHKLVKIKANVTIHAGTVTEITLKNVKRTIPFTPSSGALGNASNSGIIPIFTGSSNSNLVCCAIIPPQTISSGADFITVTTSRYGALNYRVPANVTLASGSQYIYNVHVYDGYITVTTNVTAWDESTATPVPGQGTLNRPRLPIEYIAPYNMQTATLMATDNLPSHSMYFCWNKSKAPSNGVGTPSDWTNSAQDDIKAMVRGTAVPGYHLPSKAEWCSIMAPYLAGSDDSTMGGTTGSRISYSNGKHENLKERVAWGVKNDNGTFTFDVNRDFYNDYNCPNDAEHTHIGYGLRFKEESGGNYVNGQYTCAYRYEYKTTDASVGGGASLTVQVIYIGANPNITISTISNENWWTSPEYTVVLPACGYSPYTNGSNQPADYYSSATTPFGGNYWAATAKDASYVYNLSFSGDHVLGNYNYQPGHGFSVRLFKDARPKLPIEYVAPYNMQTATTMASNNNVANSAYFYWGSNTTTPTDQMKAFINGSAKAGYHLPTKAEWCSIVTPNFAQINESTPANIDASMGGKNRERITFKVGQHLNKTETVAWGVINNNTNSTWSANNYTYAINQVFYNDYDSPNDAEHTYIGYGLRFKPSPSANGEYTCAYRYEYKASDSSVGGGASLTVMVKYVGIDQSVSIETINKESWWTDPEYTVVIPACGNKGNSSSNYASGNYGSASNKEAGFYWSASVRDASLLWRVGFEAAGVNGNLWNEPTHSYSVRLFKDR